MHISIINEKLTRKRRNGLATFELLFEYTAKDTVGYSWSAEHTQFVIGFWELLPVCAGDNCPSGARCVRSGIPGTLSPVSGQVCLMARRILNNILDFYFAWFLRNKIQPHVVQRFAFMVLPMICHLIVFYILSAEVTTQNIGKEIADTGLTGMEVLGEIRKLLKEIGLLMDKIGLEVEPVAKQVKRPKKTAGNGKDKGTNKGDPVHYESLLSG